jgi:hypothetical protein
MTLLSRWGREPQGVTVTIDRSVDMQTPPVEQVNKMTPDGIEAGRSFDVAKVEPIIRQALQMAPTFGQSALIAEWPKVGRTANGWVMNTDSGVYGANYLKRGAVAMFEIGMNLPEDSIYPDTGITPLDGRNRYGELEKPNRPAHVG